MSQPTMSSPSALAVLIRWRAQIPGAQLAHYVFPHEKYGIAGNDRQPGTQPMHRWNVALEAARKHANVACRFHDLRHTFISRLAESQASDSTVMALAGHVRRAMMERYSHIRMEAKRRAVDTPSGADFDEGVAQNWAHFLSRRNPKRLRRLLIDNSLTFGGFHYNDPREIYVEFRWRFHY